EARPRLPLSRGGRLPMRSGAVIVLGADGYLGWPTSLYLSASGYHVIAVDNLVRRRWDRECGTSSLVPIRSMGQRVRQWQRSAADDIEWQRLDVCDADGLSELIRRSHPQAVVHFGEQRSAPFSMVDREHAVMTQVNNV